MKKSEFRVLTHWFKHFRQHQRDVMAEGGGMVTTFPSGRTELSFASAPFGEHALSAWLAAKSHVHFLKRHGIKP